MMALQLQRSNVNGQTCDVLIELVLTEHGLLEHSIVVLM